MTRQVQTPAEQVQRAVMKRSLQRFVGAGSLRTVPKQVRDVSESCNSCQLHILSSCFGKICFNSELNLEWLTVFHALIMQYILWNLYLSSSKHISLTGVPYVQQLATAINGRDNYEYQYGKRYQHNKCPLLI
jgi:hypothetical protein